MTRPRRQPEPIEDYLDELLCCLRLPPRATRRLLAETEDHLREAAARAELAGASPVDAERLAIEEFGSPEQVSVAAIAGRRPSVAAATGVLAWSGVMLGGVGLTAVGLSGAVAALFNLVAGRRFVGALHGSYPASACHRFLTIHPGAANCAAAAVLENSGDAVALRLLAGAVGIVVVGAAWWARRYLSQDTRFRQMLAAAVSATAVLAFGGAAVVLFAMSADTAVQYGGGGVGWYLSGGLVSLVGAGIAGALCRRQARAIRPWRTFQIAGGDRGA
jgi:hypothetical protein